VAVGATFFADTGVCAVVLETAGVTGCAGAGTALGVGFKVGAGVTGATTAGAAATTGAGAGVGAGTTLTSGGFGAGGGGVGGLGGAFGITRRVCSPETLRKVGDCGADTGARFSVFNVIRFFVVVSSGFAASGVFTGDLSVLFFEAAINS